MNTKLINFRTPEDLQNTFDLVCDYKSVTRTQVLIDLMRGYILENHKSIMDQIHLIKELNKNLSESVPNGARWINNPSNQTTNFKEEYWEPVDDIEFDGSI
jgi:hypothetical protein